MHFSQVIFAFVLPFALAFADPGEISFEPFTPELSDTALEKHLVDTFAQGEVWFFKDPAAVRTLLPESLKSKLRTEAPPFESLFRFGRPFALDAAIEKSKAHLFLSAEERDALPTKTLHSYYSYQWEHFQLRPAFFLTRTSEEAAGDSQPLKLGDKFVTPLSLATWREISSTERQSAIDELRRDVNENNAGLRLADEGALELPVFVRRSLHRFETNHGPNCYWTCLQFHRTEFETPRYLAGSKLLRELYRGYRFVRTGEELKFGDILAYTQPGDSYPQHVANFIHGDVVFTKNGLHRLNSYVLQRRKFVEKLFFGDKPFRLMVFRPAAPGEAISPEGIAPAEHPSYLD